MMRDLSAPWFDATSGSVPTVDALPLLSPSVHLAYLATAHLLRGLGVVLEAFRNREWVRVGRRGQLASCVLLEMTVGAPSFGDRGRVPPSATTVEGARRTCQSTCLGGGSGNWSRADTEGELRIARGTRVHSARLPRPGPGVDAGATLLAVFHVEHAFSCVSSQLPAHSVDRRCLFRRRERDWACGEPEHGGERRAGEPPAVRLVRGGL